MARVPDDVFFKDPSILWKGGRAFDLGPFSSGKTYAEQINATARYIIYACVLAMSYAIDPFLFAIVASAALFAFWRQSQKTDDRPQRHTRPANCQAPSTDNPMANFLSNEYNDSPHRPPGCNPVAYADEMKAALDHNTIQDADDLYDRDNSQRQFYQTPNTEVCSDQTKFAKACFGEIGIRKSLGIRNTQI
jgi:hypothetical protein